MAQLDDATLEMLNELNDEARDGADIMTDEELEEFWANDPDYAELRHWVPAPVKPIAAPERKPAPAVACNSVPAMTYGFDVKAEAWVRALGRVAAEGIRVVKYALKQGTVVGETSITATVAGSRGAEYRVVVDVLLLGVFVGCTCAAGDQLIPCKHVAAVLARGGHVAVKSPSVGAKPVATDAEVARRREAGMRLIRGQR